MCCVERADPAMQQYRAGKRKGDMSDLYRVRWKSRIREDYAGKGQEFSTLEEAKIWCVHMNDMCPEIYHWVEKVEQKDVSE